MASKRTGPSECKSATQRVFANVSEEPQNEVTWSRADSLVKFIPKDTAIKGLVASLWCY